MNIKERFKKIFRDEFDDPNEAFQEFLLSLIPTNSLLRIITGIEEYEFNKDLQLWIKK